MTSVKRRLLIRPGAVGDCILCLPAMEWLRAPFTEVWVPAAVLPLIRFADATASIAATGLDSLGLPDRETPPALIERLRSFDSIVSWYGANRPEFQKAVARLPFQFLQALPAAGGIRHASDFFASQVGAPLPAFPRIAAARKRGGYAVIHPFSGSPRKNWPLERFREVARALDLPVRWCAGPEEPLEDAVRFDDLGELADWLAAASVYIGNDSGITHLAAAVGTPVTTVFLASEPRVWAPRGPAVRIFAGDATPRQVAFAARAMALAEGARDPVR